MQKLQKNLFIILTIIFVLLTTKNVLADKNLNKNLDKNLDSEKSEKSDENYSFRPILSGSVLYQIQYDHIINSNKKDLKRSNAFVYIEPNFGLHFDENWSIKTQWRIQDNSSLTTRDKNNPERYRTFFTDNRGLNLSETGLLIEELKLFYENEDMKFTLGKFDPSFGTAHRKSKRIGVFASQFAEDYNLREKIGGSITALLEGSQISFSSFFADSTDLSQSAINDRGRESRNNGLSSNTGSLSSYSILMEGENFLTVDNWFYNVGYRSMGVDLNGRKRETGYVVGSEYLYKIGRETSLIPFVEIVRLENFSGESGRVGNYATIAAIGKYSSWTASASLMVRNIKRANNSPILSKSDNDKQLQFSIGYKFTDNLTIDISRAEISEQKYRGGIFGANINYLYKF